jgi:hypothetical protein
MKKKLVIAGSASLQEKVNYWKSYWEERDFDVTNYPAPIPEETFLQEYPAVHKKFFQDLESANAVFVMNEDKKGIKGYIGAESFAELCFVISRNLLHNAQIELVLFQMPEEKVQSYEEIKLWLQLGWIRLLTQK